MDNEHICCVMCYFYRFAREAVFCLQVSIPVNTCCHCVIGGQDECMLAIDLREPTDLGNGGRQRTECFVGHSAHCPIVPVLRLADTLMTLED